MAYYNYIIHLDLVRNNKLFYIRRKEMKKAVKKLKDMLKWSDRIGSDEIHEIHTIINLLEEGGRKWTTT